MLDPDYLDKAVGVFYRKRRPRRTFPELVSDAVDFILTGYHPKIVMARSKKNTRRAALEAHAAVSIYYRLLKVCQRHTKDPNEHLTALHEIDGDDLPAAPEDIGPVNSKEASRRLEILQAMLDFDGHRQAQELRKFLGVFAATLDVQGARESIGLTGPQLTRLFRWARERYSAVLS